MDGHDVPFSTLSLTMEDGRVLTPGQITPAQPLGFPLRAVVAVRADIPALADGKHTLAITFLSHGRSASSNSRWRMRPRRHARNRRKNT